MWVLIVLLLVGVQATRSSHQITRVYTVYSMQGGSEPQPTPAGKGTWHQVLDHFQSSLAKSALGNDDLELRILRFNASSVARVNHIGGNMPLDTWSTSMYFSEAKRMEERLGRKRWLAWHAAMFFKAESWARVAKDRANAGKIVVCADADHTFFPGWQAVVESCVERHDLCFEANFKTTGTEQEIHAKLVNLPAETPNASFWRYGWVNTGLFAMRCGPMTHNFWASVMMTMRHLFDSHGHANDQTAVNVLLPIKPVSWGLLDPYAINQASAFVLRHVAVRGVHDGSVKTRETLGRRAQRMMDQMVVHHAAYLGNRNDDHEFKCDESVGGTATCKLRLMRMANETWFTKRCSDTYCGQFLPHHV